ncbi:unnamed protein product [Gordionus sp. m RMFG-2023]|uniref:paramyosin-like n=1 Tax=Gordionus sp. m RMFG-2023 TaxID=3053472 RepID=UPI0030E3C3C7
MSAIIKRTFMTKDIGPSSGLDVWSPEFSRLQDKIRLLEEDLDGERELRARIDRDRNDLGVQLLAINDRLEDADNISQQQADVNRKRDQEIAKLRKLLDDLHLEQEDYANSIRQKHQSQIAELNEIIEQLQKAKNKMDKDRQKLHMELIDATSQLDAVTKDKLAADRTIDKLQSQVNEFSLRIQEQIKLLNEANIVRDRLSKENNDLLQECKDANAAKEQIILLKNDIQRALDDTRRSLDEELRIKQTLQTNLRSLENEVDHLRLQIEEETELKLEIERQLVKANNDAAAFKSKYDQEVILHHEEVEEYRRRLAQKIAEFEEQLSQLHSRCTNLEKAKTRLQSELDVTLIDLDKANQTISLLESKVISLEKGLAEYKIKNEALLRELDEAQKLLRSAQSELAKARTENEKLNERNNALIRENKKLNDDIGELKGALSDANRRNHELEVALKRMEDERNEYAALYKDAENGRRIEEARANKAISDLAAAKQEFERRLQEKEDELEHTRKAMQAEIDALTARIADVEAKMRAEIQRIRKKLGAEIAELELSLDHANKTNIENMKTIKKLQQQLMDVKSQFDDAQRQLASALDQLSVFQRKAAALQGELEEVRNALDQAFRAKKQAEAEAEEATSRANELASVNASLTNIRAKLETDLAGVSAELDDTHKELKIYQERAAKSAADAQRFEDELRHEQEQSMKIDTLRKAAEQQVKELQIRIQEVEAQALITAKRMVSKLEARVRDLEIVFESEKKAHQETHKNLRKKDRRVKELTIMMEEEHQKSNNFIDTINLLNERLKKYKEQVGDIETLAVQHLAKSRRFQKELEDQEARAEMAENNLVRLRAKNRGNVFIGPATGPIVSGQLIPQALPYVRDPFYYENAILPPRRRRGSIMENVDFIPSSNIHHHHLSHHHNHNSHALLPYVQPRRYSVISF